MFCKNVKWWEVCCAESRGFEHGLIVATRNLNSADLRANVGRIFGQNLGHELGQDLGHKFGQDLKQNCKQDFGQDGGQVSDKIKKIWFKISELVCVRIGVRHVFEI